MGKIEKTVADATSIPWQNHDTLHPIEVPAAVCCHFCGSVGVIVGQFPRREYGTKQPYQKLHAEIERFN